MSDTAVPKKILICDDEELYVEILEKILSDNGFSVSTANDGFQCLEQLTEAAPDLMLLDIDIPHGNGLQLMETLSKQPEFARLQIVVISGHQDEYVMERSRQLGAKKFMIKPINIKNLIEEIKKLLGVEQVSDGSSKADPR